MKEEHLNAFRSNCNSLKEVSNSLREYGLRIAKPLISYFELIMYFSFDIRGPVRKITEDKFPPKRPYCCAKMVVKAYDKDYVIILDADGSFFSRGIYLNTKNDKGKMLIADIVARHSPIYSYRMEGGYMELNFISSLSTKLAKQNPKKVAQELYKIGAYYKSLLKLSEEERKKILNETRNFERKMGTQIKALTESLQHTC